MIFDTFFTLPWILCSIGWGIICILIEYFIVIKGSLTPFPSNKIIPHLIGSFLSGAFIMFVIGHLIYISLTGDVS